MKCHLNGVWLAGRWCQTLNTGWVKWFSRVSGTWPGGYKTWVHSQTQNKAQWLAAWGHVSASSQSLRFILSLRLYSSFITSRPAFLRKPIGLRLSEERGKPPAPTPTPSGSTHVNYPPIICKVWMTCLKTSQFHQKTPQSDITHQTMTVRWRSSHYAVTDVSNENNNIHGRSPNVIIVIFHTIRNCS